MWCAYGAYKVVEAWTIHTLSCKKHAIEDYHTFYPLPYCLIIMFNRIVFAAFTMVYQPSKRTK